MSNRRRFINLAESVRSLDVDADTKAKVAAVVTESLTDQDDFNAERFTAHATSTYAYKPQWNEDAQEWTYTDAEGNTVALKRGNGVEVREAVSA